MAAGHGGGNTWIYLLVGGSIGAGAGMGLEAAHIGPGWLCGALLAIGGIAVVFAACETMVKCVDGFCKRAGSSEYVGGALAGLAANIPELVMLGFIVAAEPRIAFILTGLTLHIGALTFGVYSALLPRDESGQATMPRPLVVVSTDLYACAGVLLLVTGALMLMMREFGSSQTVTPALTAADLYVLGGVLLGVQAVALTRMITRFSSQPSSATDGSTAATAPSDDALRKAQPTDDAAGLGALIFYGALALVASVVGGHAVGAFADLLVDSLTEAGYSEMIGALVLAFFSCASVFVMIITTHLKGKHDLAMANVSSAVTQVPFLVWPLVMIMYAAFAQLGIIDRLPDGGLLPIDLETTSVVILGFPPMLILWKSVQDDGKVNWIETASMVAVFVAILYFLGVHG